MATVGGGEGEEGGVGVGVAQLPPLECELHSGIPGQSEAHGNASVVRLHAQQPRDQRPVGAVARPGGGEGAVEYDVGGGGGAPQKLPSHQPHPHGARRVGAGGADHDGAEYIEEAHGVSSQILIAGKSI